ncbi:MAG TPA: hypothetical protein VNS11_01175 [Sphingomicrobium sp.]|nr:hypothetical protein [Sphingomicrobium sp.]
MRIAIAAALALTAISSVQAQTTAVPSNVDYSTAAPIEGNWAYVTLAGGSEATFANAAGQPQLTISCARAVRQVTLSKPATIAAPFIAVWTTAQTRNLPSSYNPATGRLSATLAAFDPFLDAIAFSRGRVAFTVSGQPALIIPTWAEPARVIEDCRV